MKMRSKHWTWGLSVGLILSVIAGFFVHFYFPPKIHFLWERVPFFSAFYGFVGCILIILGSKALGHWWLQKEENYYEAKERMQREDQ